MRRVTAIPIRRSKRPILITGGCGFIGCNLVDALAAQGQPVTVLDNFARAGVEENRSWLVNRHAGAISIEAGDVCDAATVERLVRSASAVLHLAGQVAVTTSLTDPKADFAVNAGGTLNVLEAVRRCNPDAPVLFASTNKVYGRLFSSEDVRKVDVRYEPRHLRFARGIDERAPLDLYSPYGCSKGAADQYVLDYARVFGLRTAVLRMSCVYGLRQFGTEDQGWVAHFLKQAIAGEPITIYGDGCQVRDVLYVEDAVAAWLGVLERIDDVAGRAFNLGGGTDNAVSLRQLLDIIAVARGEHPHVSYQGWRPGDQPWYVSDISAIRQAIGWKPKVKLQDGLARLHLWLNSRFASHVITRPLLEAHA